MFLIITIALQVKANILQTFSTFLRLPPFWVGSIIWAGWKRANSFLASFSPQLCASGSHMFINTELLCKRTREQSTIGKVLSALASNQMNCHWPYVGHYLLFYVRMDTVETVLLKICLALAERLKSCTFYTFVELSVFAQFCTFAKFSGVAQFFYNCLSFIYIHSLIEREKNLRNI